MNMRRSKYNASKAEYNGIRFDSKAERDRYIVLEEKQRTGEIHGLERQVKFELLPAYVLDGKKIRSVTYVADFVYYENGVKVIEDVKGYDKEKVFLLKKKMFEYKYGKLTLTK